MPRSHPVSVANRQRKLKVDTPALRRLARRVLEGEAAPAGGAIELVFLRDEAMARLNEAYRDREGPTDVLSFAYAGDELDVSGEGDEGAAAVPSGVPGAPGPEPHEQAPLGSVVVSVDRAQAQAAERGHGVDEELARLVVHGVLHLMGYDDQNAGDRRRMRRREDHYLNTRTEGR